MMNIETERLRIRNLIQADAEEMFDYRNNPICARYQRGQTKDLEDIKQLIAQHQDDVVNLDEPFIFAIALKDNDELIGEVVVMPNDHVISWVIPFHINTSAEATPMKPWKL